jgi:hypothetical protein
MDGACTWWAISGNQTQGVPGVLINDGTSSIYCSGNAFAPGIAVAAYSTTGTGQITVLSVEPQNLAVLPVNAIDGTVMYCADGTKTLPVVAGGGGCIAKRLAGQWDGT